MKLRLWRVFNLFRRNVLMNFLTLGAIFFLIPLVILALTGTLAGWTFVGLLALNLVWVLTYLLGCPSSLRLEGDTAEFTEYYEVRKGDHKRLHCLMSEGFAFAVMPKSNPAECSPTRAALCLRLREFRISGASARNGENPESRESGETVHKGNPATFIRAYRAFRSGIAR